MNLSKSALEEQMAFQMKAAGLPTFEREVQAIPSRRFRFDFAWPERKVALEVHGGEWMRGRHTRGGGLTQDCEKNALAILAGWTVLSVTGTMVKNGKALEFIERILRGE